MCPIETILLSGTGITVKGCVDFTVKMNLTQGFLNPGDHRPPLETKKILLIMNFLETSLSRGPLTAISSGVQQTTER